LIRGANFGAEPTATIEGPAGLSLGNLRTNERGTYLFLDLEIAPNAVVGRRWIHIATPQGTAEAVFDLTPQLEREGRFQGFSPDDVIYLVLPDRFCDGDAANNEPAGARGMYDPSKTRYYHGGDFAGIRNRLGYLKDLGVTAIWMTPIYDNADRPNTEIVYDGQPSIDYHGYGAVDFYNTEKHFGTLEELRHLVDDAHAMGIKVIQDQVVNHVGPFHPWVNDPPTPTWFHGTLERHSTCKWDVWSLMSPHSTSASQADTLDGWFAGILPDMNQEDPEAARYLIQNALWWLGTIGFDGIRQDTLCYAPRHFWRDWTAAIKREFPEVKIVGEVNDRNPVAVAYFQGGRKQADGIDTGVDTLFDYGLYDVMTRVFAAGEPIRTLPAALANDWIYTRPDLLVTFLDLHDVPRFLSAAPGATTKRLKLAQTFLLTARGIPMLYFGDEIGMTGRDDPENRKHFPGGFPGDLQDAFTTAGRTAEQQAIFLHVQQLLRLRGGLAPLRRGAMLDLLVTDQQYVYARRLPDGSAVLIALNNAATPASIEVPMQDIAWSEGLTLKDCLGTGGGRISGDVLRLTLAPVSGRILVPTIPPKATSSAHGK